MVWALDRIADAATEKLRAHDAALREEDAVYGLDSLSEIALHPLIGAGLAAAGFGVLREQPFPHEWVRKLRAGELTEGAALPVPRDRMRCDLVLTSEPGLTLDDSLIAEKRRRAEAKELAGTLFESLGESHLAPGAVSLAPNHNHEPLARAVQAVVTPEDAFWLEIKLVGQFSYSSGVPGANRTYSSELTRNPLADLKKLAADERICHAGVLLVVFTADEKIARHDLRVLADRALDRDLPVPLTGPIVRGFAVPDRIGNAHCTLCLLPLRKA